MGELVDLEEYKKNKEHEETLKIQEELNWLKQKLESVISEKYIPVYSTEQEYYHWHPPHLISYHEYYSESSWGVPESYDSLIIQEDFDWEKS